MEEAWKDITDFENYRVSNRGRVWSKKTNRYLKQHRYGTKKSEDRQHLRVRLYFEGCGRKPKKYSVHQIVIKEFGIPQPEGMDMIDHIDGDVTNNCIDNLRWSNNKLNQRNMIGTLSRGNIDIIGISRIENYKRFSVSIRGDGRRYFKNFHDSTYGGKDQAFEAAKQWRRQKEEEFGYTTTTV